MLQPVPSDEEIAQQLVFIEHQISLLQVEASMLAAELDRSGFLEDAGYNSPTDWLRFNCHLTDKVAGDRIQVGQHLAELPMSVDYLRDGQIGYSHLAVMARTAEAVGKVFDERKLLGLALEFTPGRFYYKSLHYRHSVDAKAYAATQSDHATNHHLTLSTGEEGHLLISGVLDPIGGAAVRSALEPLARKSGAHDDRLLPQRYADALVELASGGRPANLQVTASLETLKGLAGAAAGEMEFSLPISSTTIQRMACDCSVTRVLLSQESLTIDVGRSKRLIGGPVSKALKIRDRHCRWPGCERPASWCDGHHLVHWIHGGGTNLDNLVLLCRRHHRMVHEGGWQLIKTDDEQIITIAPTVTFGLPRGPD
jgi:hypothetical protein